MPNKGLQLRVPIPLAALVEGRIKKQLIAHMSVMQALPEIQIFNLDIRSHAFGLFGAAEQVGGLGSIWRTASGAS